MRGDDITKSVPACEAEGFCLKWPFFNRLCRQLYIHLRDAAQLPEASNLFVSASLWRRNS
jgi:hypothetical protein